MPAPAGEQPAGSDRLDHARSGTSEAGDAFLQIPFATKIPGDCATANPDPTPFRRMKGGIDHRKDERSGFELEFSGKRLARRKSQIAADGRRRDIFDRVGSALPGFGPRRRDFRRHDRHRKHELRPLAIFERAPVRGNRLDLWFLDGAQLRRSGKRAGAIGHRHDGNCGRGQESVLIRTVAGAGQRGLGDLPGIQQEVTYCRLDAGSHEENTSSSRRGCARDHGIRRCPYMP